MGRTYDATEARTEADTGRLAAVVLGASASVRHPQFSHVPDRSRALPSAACDANRFMDWSVIVVVACFTTARIQHDSADEFVDIAARQQTCSGSVDGPMHVAKVRGAFESRRPLHRNCRSEALSKGLLSSLGTTALLRRSATAYCRTVRHDRHVRSLRPRRASCERPRWVDGPRSFR